MNIFVKAYKWVMNQLKRLYNWVLHWADTPYGTLALGVNSFIEAIFFPIPPDLLQIALSVQRSKRSFYYATISLICSLAGGVAGFYLGYAIGDQVVQFFVKYVPMFNQEAVDGFQKWWNDVAYLAVFLAAFSPIPYKVVTIISGWIATNSANNMQLGLFILYSAFGRALRFFAVAILIFFFGATIKEKIDKYFNWVAIILAVLLVGGFIALRFLRGTGH